MGQRTQKLFVLRHGERWDDANPGWVDARMWDPPLTERGWEQATEVGKKFRTKEGVVIRRILVSPFLRCVQTCAGFLSGMYPDGADISKVQVSIEYGLAELMNNVAIRNPRHPDSSEPWHLPFEKLYSILPRGVVDTSVQSILPKLPEWGEETNAGHERYAKTFTAVADKFPDEDVLCISHGEGIAWSVMYLRPDVLLYSVPYCSYSRAEREVTETPFNAGPWKLVTDLGPASGLLYTENRAANPSEVPSH